MSETSVNLDTLYRQRFDDRERDAKRGVWTVLCEEFFAKYVKPSDVVVDVGAGYCEFINHIKAARRIAVDDNPELASFAGPGVEAHRCRAESLGFLADKSVDVAFSSNFFEHLPNKEALTLVIREIRRVLKPGGLLIAMGPNVKFLPGQYWDYFDHHIPLTETSVSELLKLEGFTLQQVLPKFMPFSVKGRLPAWRFLVQMYLKIGQPAFAAFGKQFLVVAKNG